MKAVVMGMAKQVFPKEVEDAKAAENETLIRVNKVLICGSDKHTFDNGDMPNAIAGHEYVGTVIDPGPRTDLKVGDRVTSITQNPCMECEFCKEGNTSLCDSNAVFPGGGIIPGAFAEMFAARGDLVCKVPDNVSDNAASATEPVAVSLHAVNLAGIKPGDKVLFSGVGALSAFACQIAKAKGAAMVVATGSSLKRAQALLDNGDLDYFINPNEPGFISKLKELAGGNGYDAYIDFKGDIENMSNHMFALKKGRNAVYCGINTNDRSRFNLFETLMRGHHIIGSYAYNNDEFTESIRMMADGEIAPEKYVYKFFSPDQAQEAFEYSGARGTLEFKVGFEF